MASTSLPVPNLYSVTVPDSAMSRGNDLLSVDNELEQLTRALSTATSHNFLAVCEESAHGNKDLDLPTVAATRIFHDPLQRLARLATPCNSYELSLCEQTSSTSPTLQEVPPPAAVPACAPSCGCKHCVWLDDIFASNRRWAKGLSRINPNFFSDMAQEDTPSFLWIGCADSRVVPNRVTGLQPGSLYVHRNVGNVAKPCDPNCMSALEYSVNSLQVRHVVVCGHYGCGAVTAALKDPTTTPGILNFWVQDIRQLAKHHQQELQGMSTERQVARLCELNVVRQVMNICNSAVVRTAWERGQQLRVHGLIYDVKTGLLRRMVEPVSSACQDFAVRAANEQQHEHQAMAAAFSAATQELLKAQGITSPHPDEDTACMPLSPSRLLARAAAAMHNRAPGGSSTAGGSAPASPRARSLCGSTPENPELHALQEEVAWLRSSEACAVDAAHHLMEQTRALLQEKQNMTKTIAEQAATIKWLEERIHFLEDESEHLRLSAPTQLIKRYRELHDLPSDSLSSDLLEELHLLKGLMAVGGQLSSPVASHPCAPSLPPAMPWDRCNDLCPPHLDMQYGPTTIPVWNYTVQDLTPLDTSSLKTPQQHPTAKAALLDQVSHSPTKAFKPPKPDPCPVEPLSAPPLLAEPTADVSVLAGAKSGVEPDLWYLLGAHNNPSQPHRHESAVSSPSANSLPPSSELSSHLDSFHPGGDAQTHYSYRTSLDSQVSHSLQETKQQLATTPHLPGGTFAVAPTAEALASMTAAFAFVTSHNASERESVSEKDSVQERESVPGNTTSPLVDAAAASANAPSSPLTLKTVAALPAFLLPEAEVAGAKPADIEAIEAAGEEATEAAPDPVSEVSEMAAPGASPTTMLTEWGLLELPEWLRDVVDLSATGSALNIATPHTRAAGRLADAAMVAAAALQPQPTPPLLMAEADTAASTLLAKIAAPATTALQLAHPASLSVAGTERTAEAEAAVEAEHARKEQPSMGNNSAIREPAIADEPLLFPPLSPMSLAEPGSPFCLPASIPVSLPFTPTSTAGTMQLPAPPAPIRAPAAPTDTPTSTAAASFSPCSVSSLPLLPPKRSLSLQNGNGKKEKRIVVKHGPSLAGESAHSSKLHRISKETKRLSRSHSSRTSTISSASSQCSLKLSSDSSPASALRRMAEELMELENSLCEEDENSLCEEDSAVKQQPQMWEVKAQGRPHLTGINVVGHAGRAKGVGPHSNGHKGMTGCKGKVTFGCITAKPVPQLPPMGLPAACTPTLSFPATITHSTTSVQLAPSHPPSTSHAPACTSFSPVSTNYGPAARLHSILEEQPQQALVPAQHDAAQPLVAGFPTASASLSRTEHKRGGWLGAVGRATIAVAVGLLLKLAA